MNYLRSLAALGVLLAAAPALADAPEAAAAAFGFGDKLMLFVSFVVIGVGMLSSGFALSISLSAYAACEKDRRGAAFIPAVMPGSQGLYAFAIGFLMIGNVKSAWGDPAMMFKVTLAGIICGLPCLFSALGQARTAAACIKSINNGQMEQGQALLATGVPELYALVGLAGGFLVMN
ncbi:MAG: V-type synthase subunit [Pseudomonadota bacterium]|jgi:F0F1-type ATP synthase membrane subunit c/vacuolar-type H+-ATPase subunit K